MNGVINIYKPEGITSFDVVRKLRSITGEKKIGHTGTLDPLASGVLPICMGKATKIVDYIMNNEKVYNVQLKLGVITDTYDREGIILHEGSIDGLDIDMIKRCIYSFEGNIKQVPPMYSALKVNGQKLYDLARKGIEIERDARDISIYKIDIEHIDIPFVNFKVKCSKGTYIRSLCYDIGEKLGCGGMMYSLEREENGAFTKSNSVKLENLTKDNIEPYIMSLDKALYNYEKIKIKNTFEKFLINGLCVKDPRYTADNVVENVIYRVYNENDVFLGLGQKNYMGFKIIKLLI